MTPTPAAATVEPPLKALPQLEVDVETAKQAWDHAGSPEAERLQTDIDSTNRELADLNREAMTARMVLLQARSADRSIGPDLALGL